MLQRKIMTHILFQFFMVNTLGWSVAVLYTGIILAPGHTGDDFPWHHSPAYLLTGLAVSALVLLFVNRKKLRALFNVASDRQGIHEFERDTVHRLQKAALGFPLWITVINCAVWAMTGLIFIFLEAVAASRVFQFEDPVFIYCLKRFLGVMLLGGGMSCPAVFFIVENSWRPYVVKFFPNGIPPLLRPCFGLTVKKRFLIVVSGVVLVPLPVTGIMIFSALDTFDRADPLARARGMAALFREILFVGSESAAIACLLSYLLLKSISGPLFRLNRTIREVEKNNLDTRAAISSGDELGELSRGVDLMIERLQQSRDANKCLGRYMCREVRDEILSGNRSLNGEMKRVTLLFSDLRNFTGLVETNHPRKVVSILNQYFNAMTRAVRAHKGLILQYVGDEIEAVFGAPGEYDDHPEMAVRAGLAMRENLAELNARLNFQGIPALSHGIGIHSGAVLAGNIGNEERMSYTLVGDTVNTASRIEALAREYETDIIISQTTHDLLTGSYDMHQLPPVTVKGKKNGLLLYKLVSGRP